jgi:hypothetical protein
VISGRQSHPRGEKIPLRSEPAVVISHRSGCDLAPVAASGTSNTLRVL